MKLVKYFLYLLLLASAVIIVMFFANGGSDSMVSLLLNWTYVLFGVSIVAIAILPFIYGDGKGIKGTLVKVGAFAAVVVISILCASSAPVPTSMEVTEGQLKFTDAIILLSCILMGVAVLAIVAGGVMSNLKKR